MQYRKEVDGLRALAVLPVVLFHAGVMGFSGGYVGVDIFFVISGYLITTIIIEERDKNTFSLINFYERRARRILPALVFVLIVTSIFAYLLMPGDALKSYSQSLVSVMTFSSNLFFYLTSGYFSAVAEERPLLHTWSLAVEEQYYVFFPLMIGMLWSFGKKKLLFIILLIAALSLAFAQYAAIKNYIAFNFFLIFSRAWELFLGSAIALIPAQKFRIGRWREEFLSIAGFVMILCSIVLYDEHTPFPSFYALLPVVGACLIIAYSTTTSLIGRLLSLNILVFIGLISYSLYLWHQPLFAFLRIKSIGEPSMALFLAATACSFILAIFSWKFVETPFRNKKRFDREAIFKYSSACMVAFMSLGLLGTFYQGFPQRFDVPSYASSIQHSPKRDACHTKGEDYLPPQEGCRYFGKQVNWAVLGDSHLVEPAYALAKRLEKSDVGLLHLTFSGCPPLLSLQAKEPGCTQWLNDAVSYLEGQNEIENVLVGFRYSAFLFGDQVDSYPETPDIDPSLRIKAPRSALPNPREQYWEDFRMVISRLLAAGKNVSVVYPIPELPLDIHRAIIPFSIFGEETAFDLEKITTAEYYLERHRFILTKLDSLPYGDNLHAVKPKEILCKDESCPAIIAGKALYFDSNHLSTFGAELLVEDICLTDSMCRTKYAAK